MSFAITSPGFRAGAEIPARFTCEGKDLSPPLEWSGVPSGARSLVLVVEDPDCPDPAAPKMTWVHWLLYNLPPDTRGLAEGVSEKALPAGTLAGTTDARRTGWHGPCPPVGRHRYFFRLYALDTTLPDLHRPSRSTLEQMMDGHLLASAELMGTYEKRS
jgi:Raf kinase inhibitor-like YbhB/YbcL family protein